MNEKTAQELRLDKPTRREMSRKKDAVALAVVLYDLAWLLPRTIGQDAARAQPLPASELEIMRLVARRPGLRVNEVSAALGLQSTNVSTAISSLVARGLLERQADARDARAARLVPTASALEHRDERERSWGEATQATLDGLPEETRGILLAAIPALRDLADQLAISAD